MGDLNEVTFEMIGDNFNETREKLDGIRAKRTKFICVNDDMNDPSPALLDMLHAFYEGMVPKSSPFELPPGHRNPFSRIDEMRDFIAIQQRREREEGERWKYDPNVVIGGSACLALALALLI